MLYRLPNHPETGKRLSVFDIGRWAGEKFGWEDVWRFRDGRKRIIKSDSLWKLVLFIEIDNEDDRLVFELTYGKR